MWKRASARVAASADGPYGMFHRGLVLDEALAGRLINGTTAVLLHRGPCRALQHGGKVYWLRSGDSSSCNVRVLAALTLVPMQRAKARWATTFYFTVVQGRRPGDDRAPTARQCTH